MPLIQQQKMQDIVALFEKYDKYTIATDIAVGDNKLLNNYPDVQDEPLFKEENLKFLFEMDAHIHRQLKAFQEKTI